MKAFCLVLTIVCLSGVYAGRGGGFGGGPGFGPGPHHMGHGGNGGPGGPSEPPVQPLANYNQVENYNTFSTSKAQEFNNKNLVLNFYQDVFIPKKIDNVEKYIDTVTYINHNPYAEDGLAAFKRGFAASNGMYSGTPEVRQIAADGDIVWVRVKDDAQACTDLFRIRNGKIVEHWDTCQMLEPASSNSANAHPFF